MPIICFEGPSAVGKTTLAQRLADTRDAIVIPEVNLLFSRPSDPSLTWYFERQVERWPLALAAAQSHELVILDGDPFQPFWYNWAYRYTGWAALDALVAFYEPQIVQGALSFPDRYLLLAANEQQLRERRAADATRQRRSFEYHLGFVGPQHAYFAALQQSQPERVVMIASADRETTLERTQTALQDVPPPLTLSQSLSVFHTLVAWLRTHEPTM